MVLNVLGLFREVRKVVVDEFKFYNKAAGMSKSKEVRQAFVKVAEDSRGHRDVLEALYDGVVKDDEWLVMRDLAQEDDYPECRGVVFPDLGSGDFGCDERGIIGVGIELKERLINFYGSCRLKCGSEIRECSKVLDGIIRSEKEHLKLLKNLHGSGMLGLSLVYWLYDGGITYLSETFSICLSSFM